MQAGKWKQFTPDSLGNLITVVEPDRASTTGSTLTTSYSYDWMGHVSQVLMTRAGVTQTRTYAYSDGGLLTSTTIPESGTTSYFYNSQDNTLQRKHDAKGQDIVYSYDSKKRMQSRSVYPAGQTGAEDVCQRIVSHYDYDFQGWTSTYSGNRPTYTEWGTQSQSCIAGTVPTSYQERYSYDYHGPLVGRTLAVTRNGVTSLLDSTYTLAYNSATARPQSVTYPSWNSANPIQPVFNYTFDAYGRPSGLSESDNGVGWVQNVQYDFASRLSSLQFRNGHQHGEWHDDGDYAD